MSQRTPALEITGEPPLEVKVRALGRPGAYPECTGPIESIETHMSWVFLAGDRAYKLKKPLKLPYLDFSTLEKRHQACLAELSLNWRLAPGVYLDVVPLRATAQGLGLGADGLVVDWLVIMRRLDHDLMLDNAIAKKMFDRRSVLALERPLIRFYRRAAPVRVSSVSQRIKWRNLIRQTQNLLIKPTFDLPRSQVMQIERTLSAFVLCRTALLEERSRRGKIVDGHGDLRPEHIWLGPPLAIIDCLEFNNAFRSVDPFDELAYLSVELERLGKPELGAHLLRRMSRALPESASPELVLFYRTYRAALRASLSIAHLLDPRQRTREKWRPLAMAYLRIAKKSADQLDSMLRKPANRRARGQSADERSLGQKAQLPK